jgi:hypothetical protein
MLDMAKPKSAKSAGSAWPVWFRARYKVWGLHPVTWQGWLIGLIGLIGTVYLIAGAYMSPYRGSERFFYDWLPLLAWTTFFVAVARQFSDAVQPSVKAGPKKDDKADL